MAYGIKALRKINLGLEGTKGTAVLATKTWRGEGVLKDDRTIEFVNEDIGTYMGLGRTYIPKLHATLTLDETPATFEQLPLILAAAINGTVAGTQEGGATGSGYLYTYAVPPVATANVIKTYTIEMGDNVRADEMAYSYVNEFSLSGAGGESVMMGATFFGRQASDCELTSTATLVTVEEILFSKGNLYIDATTMGNGPVTAAWLGFSLTVPSGWQEIYSGDGNLYFSAHKYVGHKDNKITGELTLEHDAIGEQEINAARAETTRKIRMTWVGGALGTQGTSTYTYKTLTIQGLIKYTDVPELGDQDGDDIVVLPFEVISDGSATALEIEIVSETSAVIA